MRCKSSEKTKIKHKRGLWSLDEDQKLKDYIVNHGVGCWTSVSIHAGLQQNGKSCKLRWINYLRPGLKREAFTLHEEKIIWALHRVLGNKWSQMSQHLRGRTDNEIKNHWHSYLKKKVNNLETGMHNNQTSCSLNFSIDPRHGSSETYGCRNLPEILFSDWLLLDQFNKFDTSDSQKTVLNTALLNEGSFSGDFQEGLSCTFADSVDHLQLKYEHQYLGGDFYDLITENNISQSFKNWHVTMYSYDNYM